MKTFYIPLIDRRFRIYAGPDEWVKWFRAIVKVGAEPDNTNREDSCPGDGSGRSYGGWIWVYSLGDREALVHELVHSICSLMSGISLEDNEEIRAIISGWIISRVTKWADDQLAARPRRKKK